MTPTTLSYRFHSGSEVVQRLSEKFPDHRFLNNDPRDCFDNCFAFFTTYRIRFDLWWIDCCDFGVSAGYYLIGTIDVPPKSTPRSSDERKLVKEEMAISLRAPSKVIAYLRIRSPHVLKHVKHQPVSTAVTSWEKELGYVQTPPFPLPKPFISPYDDSGEDVSSDEDDSC